MSLVKTMTKHGNSLALVIDRPVLDLLGIDADTPLEIRTDGNALIITPLVDEARRQLFKDKLEKIKKRHGEPLKNIDNVIDDELEKINRRHGESLRKLAE